MNLCTLLLALVALVVSLRAYSNMEAAQKEANAKALQSKLIRVQMLYHRLDRIVGISSLSPTIRKRRQKRLVPFYKAINEVEEEMKNQSNFNDEQTLCQQLDRLERLECNLLSFIEDNTGASTN